MYFFFCSKTDNLSKIAIGVALGLDITKFDYQGGLNDFFFIVKYNYKCDYIHFVVRFPAKGTGNFSAVPYFVTAIMS